MEASGVISRRLPCFPGVGIHAHSHSPSLHGVSINVGARFSGDLHLVGCRNPKASVGPRNFSGFSDTGHLRYYDGSSSATRGGGGKTEKEKSSSGKAMVKKTKKKLKLLKGLSRDLSMFSEMDFGLGHDVGEVKEKMISEAAELLLEQLQQLRAEQKELKRKKKEEKAKLRAAQMQIMESPGSSSESSDSECGEVVDMSRLKNESLIQPIVNELPPVAQSTAVNTPNPEGNTTWMQPQVANLAHPSTLFPEGNTTSTSCSSGCTGGNSLVTTTSAKKIEVCMGGKCKKSGAPALLDEFQRVVGVEGAVVGCKCMGKCRNGPNVRVLNQANSVENLDDSVRMPSNPLFIGVGLEDVGLIVSNLFGETQNDLGLAAAVGS